MKSYVKQFERSSQYIGYAMLSFVFILGFQLSLNYSLKIISEYLNYNFELSQSFKKYTHYNYGEMGAGLSEFMIYFFKHYIRILLIVFFILFQSV